MNNHDVDVAIVGGGPVGCVLALALARAGASTALIEAREPPAWNEAEVDLRVYALSRASQNILARLDLWPRIAAARVSAYDAMEVWEANGRGRVHFSAAEVGEPDLGHIVEGRLLAATLAERVRAAPDIAWHCPEKLERLNVQDECIELVLSSSQRINARVAVGADGSNSPTRRLAGIEADAKPYEQSAVVAHLRPEKPHGATARQIFRPNGPLAFLPLEDGRVSIVWSTTPEEAEHLLGLDEKAFGHAVTEAGEHALGELTLESKRASFPLQRVHAKSYVAPRVVLAGDAAHVVHPLAGQGMNLGLLDAAALAEVITDAKRAGRDVDDFLVLRRYERWRHGENLAMQTALTGFKQLFGLDSEPARSLRGAGMKLFDRAQPVKRQAIRIALGTAGDLPDLAKPLP
ncbi:MAG: UbiH/UbiF/VisC/COQ6 family ubiquinone biosynthesis hydroxylase [Gammaproteobacteria bacterium]|nr:UbiH/UbiF/VisC/COQ6 family ubiquinone biosynthesis hydroxylase [Gammaproteobacteria bacterium]